MLLDQNPHQTVTRFGCVGFLMYSNACEFSVPQMRQLCLFTPRSKWASSEKMIFLPESASSVSRSHAHLAKRCSSVYKTIFLRRKEKTTIHEISTSWKKNVRWRILYIIGIKLLHLVNVIKKILSLCTNKVSFIYHLIKYINCNAIIVYNICSMLVRLWFVKCSFRKIILVARSEWIKAGEL